MDKLLSIRIVGALAVERQFARGAAQAAAPMDALNRVANDVMRVININFESQGRRGGGSWKRITEEWEMRKIREGRPADILYYTLALKKSMTIRGADNQDLQITPNEIDLDTTLDYADVVGAERPFNTVLDSDRQRWANWIRDSILDAMYVGA